MVLWEKNFRRHNYECIIIIGLNQCQKPLPWLGMAGLSHLYKWWNWEWFMVLPTLLLGSQILGKPFDSYLRCLNAWAHPEPYFYWCPKATEDETPASISKFAFYDWLRSPIRCQLLGETCVGCHGSRWGVKYVIGKWNLKNGKPPESLSVQMKYSFWFDCPKHGWLKKMWTRIFQGSWKPNCRPVRRRDDMDQWMDIAFTITHYHAMFRQIKYSYHGEVGSESTPALIPTPGMHKLVDHKSRAATDANGADEIRFSSLHFQKHSCCGTFIGFQWYRIAT